MARGEKRIELGNIQPSHVGIGMYVQGLWHMGFVSLMGVCMA